MINTLGAFTAIATREMAMLRRDYMPSPSCGLRQRDPVVQGSRAARIHSRSRGELSGVTECYLQGTDLLRVDLAIFIHVETHECVL